MLCLGESRMMYNNMLAMMKQQYEETQTFPNKNALEVAFKGCTQHVPATTVQCLADRLSTSLKRFFCQRAWYPYCRVSSLQEAEQVA